MAKVWIESDELYPWWHVKVPGSPGGYTDPALLKQCVDIEQETLDRWERVCDAWQAVQDEMQAIAHAEHERWYAQYLADRAARR